MNLSFRSARRKISVQVGLELIKQNLEFGIVKLALGGNISRIYNHGAQFLQLSKQVVHQFVNPIVETEVLTCHSESCALQAVWIEKFRVISERLAPARPRCRIARIFARQDPQQDGGISNSTRHWSSCVLTMGNRNYPSSTKQTHSRLDTHQ